MRRIVRPRLACSGCEAFTQAALPSRPIERGRPGPGLLAHVLVSKYADHLPLYRQSRIFEREGLDLDRSTLADWVGKTTALLEPLAEAIGRHVLAGQAIFADDTPVKMLAPGTGKTATARLWTCGRDERSWGGDAPPASWYRFSPDRKGQPPRIISQVTEAGCTPMVTPSDARTACSSGHRPAAAPPPSAAP
ncbi:IS66 family transposase [Salipiger aestuarii]|uniref:IS66 family transposase n=1 Tax=Salipiger aestuarii TaxID=568098 RepID=UPI004055D8FA